MMMVLNILLATIKGQIVKPLGIVLPQLTGYIKYFVNEGKKCLS